MPDHWGFVVAAYGIAAVALGMYWRRLVQRDRQLDAARAVPRARSAARAALAREPAAASKERPAS